MELFIKHWQLAPGLRCYWWVLIRNGQKVRHLTYSCDYDNCKLHFKQYLSGPLSLNSLWENAFVTSSYQYLREINEIQ